jgi:predicted DCC family thiol-disulfide oxidoreductase YuxK
MKNKAIVCYDGSCGICRRGVRFLKFNLNRREFCFQPMQDPAIQLMLGMQTDPSMTEMKVIASDGSIIGGPAAVRFLMCRIWWLRWLAPLSETRLLKPVCDRAYLTFAANRYDHSCRLDRTEATLLTVAVPTLLALVPLWLSYTKLPGWVFMWIFAFAVFLFLKMLTYKKAGVPMGRRDAFAYLFLWPGLAPRAFMARAPLAHTEGAKAWGVAFLKFMLGLSCLFFGAQFLYQTVWCVPLAIFGTMLTLHFGAFELIAFGWRRTGRQVRPIMNRPLLAAGLLEFWSRRWNLAFRDMAHLLVFKPVHKRWGSTLGLVAVFLVSGLLHDLMISLPARGGYGLPTLYFLIQGVGCLLERRLQPTALRQRMLAYLFLLGPLPLLLHQPFLNNVVLPMMSFMATR